MAIQGVVVNGNTLDADQFRVPAKDTKGHSERVWCRLQPGHARQISTIVEQRVFPYRQKADLIRHAIVRHLRWLESLAPIPSVMSEVDLIMDIMREDEFATDFRRVLNTLGERIATHVAQGSEGEARRLLLKALKHVENMPDGYWRDRYKEEIIQKHGKFLDRAVKAQLVGGT